METMKASVSTSVLMRYTKFGAEGLFTETTAYDPNSPYSAKASSDHFVRAYGKLMVSLCTDQLF
jgi:dTDP-D-glucose 4,6-dehydratase